MSRSVIMVASVAVHGVALVVLGHLRETDLAQAATKIEVFEAKTAEAAPPPPPPPEPKAEPPKPKPRAAAPEAEPAPPLATDLGASPLAAAPDFGLSLSGGVAVAPAPAAAQRTQTAKPEARSGPVRAAANLKPVAAADSGCSDAPVKPKVLSLPRPAYSDRARAAGVEGKVRIQLTVDVSGTVTAVRVLQGLGYGLDEAAVQAAKSARFEPAVRCGKPESSTFTIAMRFTAS
jgi:protein TonB